MRILRFEDSLCVGKHTGFAKPSLPHINQLLSFPLAKIKGGDARGVVHEPYDAELFTLDGFDFQPSLGALRSIWRIGTLGDDDFPIELRRVIEHFCPSPVSCSE